MMKLAENVSGLLSSLGSTPLPFTGGIAPSTPLFGNATHPKSSPAHRDRAFRCIADIEFLTPRRLVRARVMFRGHTELANEYLSFGDADDEVVACGQWLVEELEAAALRRGRRQDDLE
jgi:hypothetical protein